MKNMSSLLAAVLTGLFLFLVFVTYNDMLGQRLEEARDRLSELHGFLRRNRVALDDGAVIDLPPGLAEAIIEDARYWWGDDGFDMLGQEARLSKVSIVHEQALTLRLGLAEIQFSPPSSHRPTLSWSAF